jgi:hypothetical protein
MDGGWVGSSLRGAKTGAEKWEGMGGGRAKGKVGQSDWGSIGTFIASHIPCAAIGETNPTSRLEISKVDDQACLG